MQDSDADVILTRFIADTEGDDGKVHGCQTGGSEEGAVDYRLGSHDVNEARQRPTTVKVATSNW